MCWNPSLSSNPVLFPWHVLGRLREYSAVLQGLDRGNRGRGAARDIYPFLLILPWLRRSWRKRIYGPALMRKHRAGLRPENRSSAILGRYSKMALIYGGFIAERRKCFSLPNACNALSMSSLGAYRGVYIFSVCIHSDMQIGNTNGILVKICFHP